MKRDEFCAICESLLVKGDSEHVCRTCFQKARERKTVEVQISDHGAERLGFALALGNFINWGFRKMVEADMVKLPPLPKTPAEAARAELEARGRLREIQKRIKRSSSES